MSCCHSSFELLLLLGTWPSACYQRVDVLSQLLDIHSAFELLLGTWPCACYQRVDVLSQLFDSSLHVGFRNYQSSHTRRARTVCFVCVFFPSILDIKFVGRTSRGHTGGRLHRIFNPPSFCGGALIFVARRIQPFLSLVDREVERINRSPPVGHFYFGFLVFSEKNPVCRDRTHVPTCQKVTRCRLSYRGRPA